MLLFYDQWNLQMQRLTSDWMFVFIEFSAKYMIRNEFFQLMSLVKIFWQHFVFTILDTWKLRWLGNKNIRLMLRDFKPEDNPYVRVKMNTKYIHKQHLNFLKLWQYSLAIVQKFRQLTCGKTFCYIYIYAVVWYLLVSRFTIGIRITKLAFVIVRVLYKCNLNHV